MWKIILVAAILAAAEAAKDNTVCTTIPPSTVTPVVTKPNITDQFHCRIEVVFVNKNQTALLHEYFDSVSNRGYVRDTRNLIRQDSWFDYSTNEFIGFFPDSPRGTPGRCYVQDLSKSDQRFLFGYNKNGPGGTGHIFSASGALHWNGKGINEVYKGRTTVRDIQVDWWQSCQYWDVFDATMIVDWYFTAQNSWNSAVGIRVPVQAHIKGVSHKNPTHTFEHYYNFFDFRPYLDADEDTVFETPAGVQCPGRKLTRGFPSVPTDAFSFTTEILDTTNLQLSFMTETFFYSQKLVMYEYTPQPGSSPYGTNDLIEVHDFHTGIAYITDRARGNCSFRPIETSDFDDKASGPNTVRIRNSKEFFYFDVKNNVSYEGIKQNRGIDCDTWVATRTDYPFNAPSKTTSIWEWYFATTQWTELNSGPESGNIPIQMRISFPDSSQYYQYNLYNFKKSKPDLLKFDISGCYQFGQRRKFQFMLQVADNVKSMISTSVEPFKYYVLQSIITATGLTPIRVANLQIFVADNIIVTFEILDVAPNIGDVKKSSSYKEVPLDFAANTIASMIQNNQFFVTLGGAAFTNVQPLLAKSDSIIEITYMNVTTTTQNQQKTGYGPGPMAGVGISMPILGAAMGVVFAYFFFK